MLKLSTLEQREFYEKKLYPMQDIVFESMRSNKFYLTRGTCLSRFYYNHRYSDDLDFFFMGQEEPLEVFEVEWNEIIKKIESKFQIEVAINNKAFKRMTLYKNNIPLKVEFIYENFPMVEKRILKSGILLDTKSNIAANKITAVHDRKTYKDYFDLFYLLKEFKLSDLIEWSNLKKVPLDYEGTLLSLSFGKLEGDVLMIQEISESELKSFIKSLTVELLNYAKTIS